MWTKKEESILKEEISKSPNNLAEAFRCAARRLKDKSYATCRNRWYSVLSNQDKVFSLESNNSNVVNTKNGAKQSKSNIPDKNSSKEELLEYARKTYPVGTEFVCTYDMLVHKVTVAEYFNIISEIWVDCGETNQKLFNGYKWAEIISKPNINTEEIKPKQKGVFLDISKLESLSISSLRELAVTKLVDIDKKKLIDLIVE